MVSGRARLAALVACALALAVLLAVVLTARDGTTPSTTRARDARVTVVMDDFRFRPQVIRARAGRLTIDLRNEGRLGHGFRLRRNGRLWVKQPTVRPGGRAVVEARLPRGDYRMFDALSNFEELGMYGTLTVR